MRIQFLGRKKEGGFNQRNPWGGLLAVTKLASRKVHGHLRRISSLSHTSKNMVQEIGDQCLLILVINYLISTSPTIISSNPFPFFLTLSISIIIKLSSSSSS